MTWATDTDVSEITGVTVDAVTLAQAQAIVELYVGRTEGAQVWPVATATWLKRAVAYQAAWMPSQPDIFSRSSTKGSMSQDGATVEFTADGRWLAPLAKRALRRLGWKGTRSIYVPSEFDGHRLAGSVAALGVVAVYDADDNTAWPDDEWRPM